MEEDDQDEIDRVKGENTEDEDGVDTSTTSEVGSGASSGLGTGGGVGLGNTGRAANLQKYIQANQGAGGLMGSAIQDKAIASGEGIQAEGTKAGEEFSGKLGGYETDLGTSAGTANALFQNPLEANDDQRKQFSSLYGGGLLGNVQGMNTAGITGARDKYGATLGGYETGLDTEDGRYDLLRSTFNRPNYTQGAQRLDQMLLQTDPSAIKNARAGIGQAKTAGLGALNKLETDSVAKQSALQTIIDNKQKEIMKLFQTGQDPSVVDPNLMGEGYQDIQRGLDARAIARRQAIQAAQAPIASITDPSQMRPEDFAAVGVTGPLYNTLPGQYMVNRDLSTINEASMSTPEEMARYNALRDLTGEINGGLSGEVGSEANRALLEFDPAFQRELANRDRAFHSNADPAMENLRRLSQMVSGGPGVPLGGYTNNGPNITGDAEFEANYNALVSAGVLPPRQPGGFTQVSTAPGLISLIKNALPGQVDALQSMGQEAGAFQQQGGLSEDQMTSQLLSSYGLSPQLMSILGLG